MEDVEPIMKWAKICALYPFTTRNETKLSRMLATIWCLLIFGLQVSETATRLQSYIFVLNSGLPTLNLITIVSEQLVSTVICFLPRIFCMRKRHLLKCLDHLESLNQKSPFHDLAFKMKRHRVIITVLVAGGLWMVPQAACVAPYALADSSQSLIYRCVAYTMKVLACAQLVFVYLMFYMAVYLIKQHTNLLEKQFQDMLSPVLEGTFSKRNSPYSPRAYTRTKTLLNDIFGASSELITAYSPFILVITTVKLITITTSVFNAVFWILNMSKSAQYGSFTVTYMLVLSTNTAMDMITICALFCVADIPMNTMRLFKNTIADCTAFHLTATERIEVKTLLLEVEEERLRFTAGGLFTIGKSLIPGILSTLVTYIIIMVQAQSPYKPKETNDS